MGALADSRRWAVLPADPQSEKRLASELGVPPLVARVLVARGYADATAARAFLDPSLETAWEDPLLVPGMGEAATRLERALDVGETIAVFGDFDVDGMTGIVKGRTYDFIAKVTDKVIVPEGGFTSADQIPEKFRDELNDIATVSDRTQQFQDYANDLYDKATKDVTDMPEGLPYDVSVYGISGDDVDAATSLVLDVDDTTTVFGCDIPYDSSKGNSDVPKIDSTWASSDESVVTVDKDGYVRALKEGTATITATQSDDDSKTATIDVTVNAVDDGSDDAE